jgi:hypothetical protein
MKRITKPATAPLFFSVITAILLASCSKSVQPPPLDKAKDVDTVVPGEFLVQLETVNGVAPNVVVDSLTIDGVVYVDGGQQNYSVNVPNIASALSVVVYTHQPNTQLPPAECYYTATPPDGTLQSYVSVYALGVYILVNVPVNNQAVLQFAQHY